METVIRQLLVQLLLIGLNAFFAATEIAVISLNETKVRRQAENGDAKARKMLRMVEEPNGFLSTIQIGITLAGFLGSAFAADSFSDVLVTWLMDTFHITAIPAATLDAAAVVVITLILSYFTLVLGELVPKRIAMRDPEKLARRVCGIISTLSVVLRPFVGLLSASTNGVLRLCGIHPKDNPEDVSEEDILDLVDAVQEQGKVDTGTRDMIAHLFEFDDTRAADVMVHRPQMIVLWLDDTPEEILNTIVSSGRSRFPVCGNSADDVHGVVLAREYLLTVRQKGACSLPEIMQEARFVPDTIPINQLFRTMQENKTHLVLVADEYGQTAGLVTMEDLLEEIVGNIYDETDRPEQAQIVRLAEHTWEISGETPLEDAEQALGIPLTEAQPDCDTFGGFIISRLGRIPKENEHPALTFGALDIRVSSVTDKRIGWARVTKQVPEPAEKPAVPVR